MSTKTTFKRVALVAVAALGFGTLSVAPSVAGTGLVGGAVTLASATSTATVGVETTVGVTMTGYCVGASAAQPQDNRGAFAIYLNSVPSTAGTGAITGLALTKSSTAPSNATSTQDNAAAIAIDCTGAGFFSAAATAKVTLPAPGTYSFKIDGVYQVGGSATWTITATAPTVKSSTAFINTNLAANSTADASSLVFPGAAAVLADARLTVQQYSTTNTATVATTAISEAVVVAIDKGLVGRTDNYFAAAKSATTAAGASTDGLSNYYVFSNGDIGTAKLTVTVGSVLVSTKTITFNGVAKSLSVALASNNPSWVAPLSTTNLTVSAKDEAGNTATNTPTITATSATTTVATVAVTNNNLVTITGVAAGTSVITIADAATSSPATSATYTVTVAPAVSATLPTLTFDKAEYAAGELMTITIGAAAADNATFAAFAAAPVASTNLITVKNPFTGGSVALAGGKATWTAYAPITAGPVTLTATSGAGSSATAATVTATATVLSDGVAQAAVDAAAEAIDAANAATDAANAAAEAADAATAAAQDAADAVAALSVQVSEQIAELKAQNDALRKQLIALTNLIIKIQKKVKA